MMAEYGGRATCTVADVVFVSIVGTILRWMHGGLVDIEWLMTPAFALV